VKSPILSHERTSFADFAANAAPVPLVFVVAAGTGQVQEDAAETEMRELSLHIVLMGFWLNWFSFITVGFICSHPFQQEKREDLTGAGGNGVTGGGAMATRGR